MRRELFDGSCPNVSRRELLAINDVHQEVKTDPPPGNHDCDSRCSMVHYALDHRSHVGDVRTFAAGDQPEDNTKENE